MILIHVFHGRNLIYFQIDRSHYKKYVRGACQRFKMLWSTISKFIRASGVRILFMTTIARAALNCNLRKEILRINLCAL